MKRIITFYLWCYPPVALWRPNAHGSAKYMLAQLSFDLGYC
ncbi:MAG TPA: hypothetical protein VGH05_18125 [Buttiauxella sp.]|jgi:hypothetical protein